MATATAVPVRTRCSHCHAAVWADQRFCHQCGRPLAVGAEQLGTAQLPPRSEPAEPSPLRAWLQPTPSRVIAAAGALLVAIGAALFLGLAISRGWLTHDVQALLAQLGGFLIAGSGIVLLERLRIRSGDEDDSLSSRDPRAIVASILVGLGAGIAELGLIAAAALYEPALLTPTEALLRSSAITILVVLAAWRYGSQPLATWGFGIALLGPAVMDATATTTVLVYVTVALAATGALVVWQRWGWLGQVGIWLTLPQLVVWTNDRFTAANPAYGTCAASEPAGIFVPWNCVDTTDLAISGLVIGGWLLLAVGPILVRELLAADGDWHLSSVAGLAAGALAALLVTANTLPGAFDDGFATLLMLLWVSLFGLLGMALQLRRQPQLASFAVSIAGGAAAIALLLQTREALATIPLAIGAFAFLSWGRRWQRLAPTVMGAILLAVTAIWGLALLPPDEIPTTFAALAEAAVGLCAVLVVLLLLAAAERDLGWAQIGWIAAAACALYLVSFGVLAPAVQGVLTDWLDWTPASAEQAAQAGVSILWATCGVAAVALSLRRHQRLWRYAGMGLLGVTAVKAVTVDASQLAAGYRVAVFLIAGVLLLIGGLLLARLDAHAEQGPDESQHKLIAAD